jgi:hypothetical protein
MALQLHRLRERAVGAIGCGSAHANREMRRGQCKPVSDIKSIRHTVAHAELVPTQIKDCWRD